MSLLSLAFTLARRELRGGLAGFRVLVACLALGVAAIAAAGSLRAAFDQSMTRDARALLGGDLDLRQTHVDFSPDERAALAGLGTVTEGIEMRASDVHLEPFEDELRVRYRIDGVLQEVPVPAQIKPQRPWPGIRPVGVQVRLPTSPWPGNRRAPGCTWSTARPQPIHATCISMAASRGRYRLSAAGSRPARAGGASRIPVA